MFALFVCHYLLARAFEVLMFLFYFSLSRQFIVFSFIVVFTHFTYVT